MSEYIFDVPDENQPIAGETGLYYPDERDEPMLVHEEVVRCRDCEHFSGWSCKKSSCSYSDSPQLVGPGGFCAWGERRTAVP